MIQPKRIILINALLVLTLNHVVIAETKNTDEILNIENTCPPTEMVQAHLNDFKLWDYQNIAWLLDKESYPGKQPPRPTDGKVQFELVSLNANNMPLCQYSLQDNDNATRTSILTTGNLPYATKATGNGVHWYAREEPICYSQQLTDCPFNLVPDKKNSTKVSFCPSIKFVIDHLNVTDDDYKVMYDNQTWRVRNQLGAQLSNAAVDMRLFQVIIGTNGSLWCNYAWGDTHRRVSGLTLYAPEDSVNKPAGYRWRKGFDGSDVCDSALPLSCAFTVVKP